MVLQSNSHLPRIVILSAVEESYHLLQSARRHQLFTRASVAKSRGKAVAVALLQHQQIFSPNC